MFEVFDKFLSESFLQSADLSYVIVDSILLFFSEMNSIFLVDTIGYFFKNIFGCEKNTEKMNMLIRFNGLKVA